MTTPLYLVYITVHESIKHESRAVVIWIFTSIGFFSVTQVSPREQADRGLPKEVLQVRARVKNDLIELKAKYLPTLSKPIHTQGRDYPYRGYVSKQELGEAMMAITMDLDYSNFKNEVKKIQGPRRANLYMDIWSTMYQAEHKLGDT